MIYLFLVFTSVLFVELVLGLKLVTAANGIFQQSFGSISIMRDDKLSDLEKEKLIQQTAAAIFKTTCMFILKLVALFAVLYVVYFLFVFLLPDMESRVMEALVSVWDLVLMTLIALCYVWGRNVIRKRL